MSSSATTTRAHSSWERTGCRYLLAGTWPKAPSPDRAALERSQRRPRRAAEGGGEVGQALQRSVHPPLRGRVRIGPQHLLERVRRVGGAPRLRETEKEGAGVAAGLPHAPCAERELEAAGVGDVFAEGQLAVHLCAAGLIAGV